MAIVLAILSLLLGAMLVSLPAQIAQRRTTETRVTLDQAKDALLGFAAANGRLPCPAIPTSNGTESFSGGGNDTTGQCATFWDGYFPAATLGLAPADAQGFLLDAWNQRIRYGVTAAGGGGLTYIYTRSNGIRDAYLSGYTPAADLKVCASATGITNAGTANATCGASITLASKAAIVLWSLGPNGAADSANPDEAQNPNPRASATTADPLYVSHDPDTQFDDILTWLSDGTLFNRMLAAGRVP